MEKIELQCTACPNGCHLAAEVEDDEVIDVDGNRCFKGYAYAQRQVLEMLDEKRNNE
ncbi:MAG: hypothetical protein ACI4UH_06660 [Dorea sp.]